MYRLNTVLLFAAVSFLAPASSCLAQSNEPSAAADAKASRDVLVGLTPAGVQRQVSGRWATLAVNGTNKTEEDTEETSVVMIGGDESVQYGRRVWIPARSRRQAWMPIHIPGDLYPDQLQVKMTSIHLQQSDQGEAYQASAVGTPTSTRSLLLSWEDSRAAAVIDPITPSMAELDKAAVLSKTIYLGRDSAVRSDQDLGMAQFTGHFLPPTANPLDSLDQLVIANDRMLNDTVGVSRLRAWLRSGGRVWIMADQMEPDSVRALLGDVVCYSIVDRIELNDYKIERLAQHSSASNLSESWASETPVEMLRVLTDSDDIQCAVDGWPAAFWLQVGEGEVLFTTLSAPGWIRGDQPTEALEVISSRFFVRRLEPPQHSAQLAGYLSKEIGYEIPSRGFIATLLGGHLLLILLAGLWLARRKALQWMGALIPVSALIAAGVLVFAGNEKTTAVPSTIATGQIVHAGMDSSEVQVESVAAVYSQTTQPLPIESSPESITLLGEKVDSGESKRILWDDSGDSHWKFVTQRQGKVQNVRTWSTVNLPAAWSVRGRFTPAGFQGELNGLDDKSFEDAVVVSAALPSLAITPEEGTRNFQSSSEDVLLPGQYMNASLISDTQQDRQSLIRELEAEEGGFFGRQPSLLFWTDPIDAGTLFPDDYQRRGWALASVPIRLERVPSGSKFKVPASFIRLRTDIGRRGTSAVFNPETGKWLESLNKASETDIRCVIPGVLQPCQLNSARIEIKVTAPGRTVAIKGRIGGEYQTLHEVYSPAGKIDFEVTNSEALELDAEGGFVIAIAVSATQMELEAQQQPAAPGQPGVRDLGEVSRSTWAIEYVHVHVDGTTL